jgi:multicomponent Na+:H+ antiporter subunit E
VDCSSDPLADPLFLTEVLCLLASTQVSAQSRKEESSKTSSLWACVCGRICSSAEVKDSARSWLPRFVALLVFWLILEGAKPQGLIIGLPATILATWLTVRLVPLWAARISPLGLLAFCGQFLWGSLVAGIDLAIRALHLRLPLRTGFIACPCRIPRGPQRDLFLAASSLMPGSLPVEEEGDGLVVLHALDVDQPHAAQMTENELRFVSALGGYPPDA